MKKINLEKSLLIFIIALPILDISSFLFRNYFDTKISISTFIRPIIPIIVIITIFFKNKFKLKTIIIGLLYAIYAAIHLYIFNKLKTEISYGTILHEAQYLMNYTFAILNLFIFLFVFYKKDTKKIANGILIANGIYILSIYISIITKTSSTTYLEGMGLKGWFESGNSISAILILNLFIVFTFFNNLENIKLKILALIEVIASGIFLVFLLGTRTGLFGFILVIASFLFSKVFILIRNTLLKSEENNLKKSKKIALIACSVFIVGVAIFVGIKGNSLLQRRKYLASIENNIVDSSTGKVSHITGDVLNFKEKIESNNVSESYISSAAKKSIISLYNYANEHNIANTNRRTQQLVYNIFLVKNQSNIFYILFGNGYLTNYGELVLEMEIPAFFFNFGIFGFILFFVPFFSLFIYFIIKGIKNIKKIDSNYVFLLIGICTSFILSLLLGQLFFNSSAMVIITAINVLLYNNINVILKRSKEENSL